MSSSAQLDLGIGPLGGEGEGQVNKMFYLGEKRFCVWRMEINFLGMCGYYGHASPHPFLWPFLRAAELSLKYKSQVWE